MLGEFVSVLNGFADCLIICLRKPEITATTITKYIEYLEDAFLVESARRYDIKGKTYIGTPLNYYIQSAYLLETKCRIFGDIDLKDIIDGLSFSMVRQWK